MLRVRAGIERASRRPWLRVLVVVALAVLLVFTVGHVTHDVLDHGEALYVVCMAVVLVVAVTPRRSVAHGVVRGAWPSDLAPPRTQLSKPVSWSAPIPLRR